MNHFTRALAVAALSALICLLVPDTTISQELAVIRVGRPDATSLTTLPVLIGESTGIWKSVGIDVQQFALRGDAQVQQALATGSVDAAMASGPGIGFLTKGVPAMVIAQLVSAPAYYALIVPSNTAIKSMNDVRGKKIAVSTVGSLTAWLTMQIAVKNGWPQSDITLVPLGDSKGEAAGAESGAVDGFVTGADTGYDMDVHGKGHVVMTFETIVQKFPTNLLYARTDFIKQHPDTVRRFLVGWFRCIAYMRSHKAEVVKFTAQAEGLSEEAIAKAYDKIMPAMSTNGVIDEAGFDRLAQSLSELGITQGKINLKQYLYQNYLPVKT
jgi:ABC-type nitrate/sulfonate/bicarbonate transport system substrate-binding protein